MRDLFPGWVPPDEKILDRYWNEATFAVDTSVLLDLYRFSQEARQGLLNALRSFGDRLWIPHQVGLEFHRNRLSVLLAQREAENNLLRELDQIRQELDKQLSQLLRGAGRRDLAPLREAIDGGFDSLREKLKEAEKEHTEGLGESIRDDPIYEEVVGLCADRVGPPFDEERWAAVIEDAEERFRTKTPPGYLDEGKDENAKYGDVILWHQLCQRASETEKPVVLVADDQKADWVWEVRGKTIGPRPELVAEMRERAGVGFHLYTPKRFLQVWEQRDGQNFDPGVLAEIESSGREVLPDAELAALGQSGSLKGLQSKYHWPSFQRPTRAYHSIRANSVELYLEFHFPFRSEVPAKMRVVVELPNGDTCSAYARIASLDPEAGVAFYEIQYPTAFPVVESLAPGDYAVAWEGVFLDNGKRIERATFLAVDFFQIEGGRG